MAPLNCRREESIEKSRKFIEERRKTGIVADDDHENHFVTLFSPFWEKLDGTVRRPQVVGKPIGKVRCGVLLRITKTNRRQQVNPAAKEEENKTKSGHRTFHMNGHRNWVLVEGRHKKVDSQGKTILEDFEGWVEQISRTDSVEWPGVNA